MDSLVDVWTRFTSRAKGINILYVPYCCNVSHVYFQLWKMRSTGSIHIALNVPGSTSMSKSYVCIRLGMNHANVQPTNLKQSLLPFASA